MSIFDLYMSSDATTTFPPPRWELTENCFDSTGNRRFMLESDAQGRTRVSVRQQPQSHRPRQTRRRLSAEPCEPPMPAVVVQQVACDDGVRSVADSWTAVTEEASSSSDEFLRAILATRKERSLPSPGSRKPSKMTYMTTPCLCLSASRMRTRLRW